MIQGTIQLNDKGGLHHQLERHRLEALIGRVWGTSAQNIPNFISPAIYGQSELHYLQVLPS